MVQNWKSLQNLTVAVDHIISHFFGRRRSTCLINSDSSTLCFWGHPKSPGQGFNPEAILLGFGLGTHGILKLVCCITSGITADFEEPQPGTTTFAVEEPLYPFKSSGFFVVITCPIILK